MWEAACCSAWRLLRAGAADTRRRGRLLLRRDPRHRAPPFAMSSRIAAAKAKAEAAFAAAAAAAKALEDAELEDAAVSIQAAARGLIARRRARLRVRAVLRLQAFCRRWKARKQSAELREERRVRDAAAAAEEEQRRAGQAAALAASSPAGGADTVAGESGDACVAGGEGGEAVPGRVGVEGPVGIETPTISRGPSQDHLALGEDTPAQLRSPSRASFVVHDALAQLRAAQAALDTAAGGTEAEEQQRCDAKEDGGAHAAAAGLTLAHASSVPRPRGGDTLAAGASGPPQHASVFHSRRATAEDARVAALLDGARAAADALRSRAEAAEAALEAAASARGRAVRVGGGDADAPAVSSPSAAMHTATGISLRRCGDTFGAYLTADAPEELRQGYLLTAADVGLLRAQMASLHRAALARAAVDAATVAAAAATHRSSKAGGASAAANGPSTSDPAKAARMAQLEARVAAAHAKVETMARDTERRKMERAVREAARQAERAQAPRGSAVPVASPSPLPPVQACDGAVAAAPAPTPAQDIPTGALASTAMVAALQAGDPWQLLATPSLAASMLGIGPSSGVLSAQLDALIAALSAWAQYANPAQALPAALSAALQEWSQRAADAIAAAAEAASTSAKQLVLLPTLTDDYLLALFAPTGVTPAELDDWESVGMLPDVPFSGRPTTGPDPASGEEAYDASAAAAGEPLAPPPMSEEDAAWAAIWEEPATGSSQKVMRPALFTNTEDGEGEGVKSQAVPKVRINSGGNAAATSSSISAVGLLGADAAAVDAAKLREEAEAERQRIVRRLQAQAAAAARAAAVERAKDEAMAGGGYDGSGF